MTKKIHDPTHQMKDFFKDESMKRIIPNNPYNILWVINHYFSDIKEYEGIKNYAKACIENNKLCYINDTHLQSTLINDQVVIKRVKELKDNYDVDINMLSCKAIRMRSLNLVNALFDMGMDPNTIDASNSIAPLFIAVGRRNQKIVSAYWNNPLTNRSVVDKEGNNIAHIAIKYNNWTLLKKIYDEEPDLLLAKNDNNDNIFDLFSKFNHGKGLFVNSDNYEYFKKLPEKLKPLLLDIIHYFYIHKENINQETSNQDIRDLLKYHSYQKLDQEISKKEDVIKRYKL